MMKLALVLLFSCSISRAAQKTLHAISNINGSSITLALDLHDGQCGLNELDLGSLKITKLSCPEDLKQEEVIGLFRFNDGIILISQWTTGGGKPPSIRFYDEKKKTWKTLGKLNCVSFDTLMIKGGVLRAECEEEPLESKKAGMMTMILPQRTWQAKVTLPRTKETFREFTVKLEGPIFHWTAMVIEDGKSTKRVAVDGL
jgi:hypothetical protein